MMKMRFRAADFIVDMGLGASVHGGEVIAHGALDDIMHETNAR